jgi:hypothetical protein
MAAFGIVTLSVFPALGERIAMISIVEGILDEDKSLKRAVECQKRDLLNV